MAYSTIPDLWSVNQVPAVATAAIASKAAGAAGVRHVAKRCTGSAAANGTAQVPLVWNLRDGATGAGTILCSWALAAVVDTLAMFDADNLHMIGTAATAMTLESAAATAAAVQGVATIQGYDN